MSVWRPIIARAAMLWVPLAAAVTGVCLLVYLVGLDNVRSAADDPQIQMVEDAVAGLDAGATPASVVPPTPVDMSSSLHPYLVVFDGAGRVLASSVTLHGRQPDFPASVFDAVRGGGQDTITWQPEPGVRSAAVVEQWRDGFVVAGRSLRLTEERETELELLAAGGWLGTTALTALAAVVVGIFAPLSGPPAWRGGGGNGHDGDDDGPSGTGSDPSAPAQRRGHRLFTRQAGRGRRLFERRGVRQR